MLTAVLVIGGLAVVAIASGVWRRLMKPFAIDPASMTPEKLGFHANASESKAIVEGVCGAFCGGFNSMVLEPRFNAWADYCDSQSTLFRPFAEEGAAMGYSLRRFGFVSPAQFEREFAIARPGFRYLHYVGLGFWHAMRNRRREHIQRVVDQLDPLHGSLCWDGYGFKSGFFDFDRRNEWQARFERLQGYARNVAHQGLGRSLRFRFMDDPERLIQEVGTFGDFAADVASGVALATVFTTIDRPQVAIDFAGQLPRQYHADAALGMCCAYKARSINDAGNFEQAMMELDPPVRDAIRTAISQCDSIEAEVRRAGGADGYRRWREALRERLARDIRYPFAGLKDRQPARPAKVSTAA